MSTCIFSIGLSLLVVNSLLLSKAGKFDMDYSWVGAKINICQPQHFANRLTNKTTKAPNSLHTYSDSYCDASGCHVDMFLNIGQNQHLSAIVLLLQTRIHPDLDTD